MTPDKIYIPENISKSDLHCISSPDSKGRGIEYIRKDALLEWAKKELESAEFTNFDEFGRGEVITWNHVLDKLNSM